MSAWFDFDEVDVFTVGAVGRPGARTFFLQARRGITHVTVKCEKQQAAAIADHLRKVLSDLPVPDARPAAPTMELHDPGEADDAAFVLGPVGLGYDRSTDMVLVQLEEVLEVDEEGEPIDPDADRGHLRVFLTRGQAAAFCDHAESIVAAGRPPCHWCNRPLDPNGHLCPRMN